MKKENKKAAHAATNTTKKKIFFPRCYKITSTLDFLWQYYKYLKRMSGYLYIKSKHFFKQNQKLIILR